MFWIFASKFHENLFRLIFETQIHIQIHHIRYFNSLPIATYYLTTIHIKNVCQHSKTYNMGLRENLYLTSFSRCRPVNLSNPNFWQYQSKRNNDKFNCCLENQSKTAARISVSTLNPLKLPSNQIHI